MNSTSGLSFIKLFTIQIEQVDYLNRLLEEPKTIIIMKNVMVVFSIFMTLSFEISAQSKNEKFTKEYKEKDKELRSDWPEVQNPIYADGTLGNKLQKNFMEHCQFCGFGDSNPTGNYLPSFFVKDETLRKSKVIDLPIGGEGLLSYLFTENDIKNIDKLTKADIVSARMLKIEGLSKFDVSTANPLLNNSYISQSCSGYFNAKFNAKITPPFSIIEAASKAETDVSKSGFIVAIEGDFLSPLPAIFNAYNVQGFSLNSSLWDYYCQFPANDAKLFYLNNYQGVLVKRFAEKDLSVETKAELSANGSFGVVSLSAEANAGFEVKNLFKATNWSALITTDLKQKADESFLKLKGSDGIVNYFGSNSYRLEGYPSKSTPVMVNGKDFIFEFFIGGLTKRMSTDYWNIESWGGETVFENKPDLMSCTPSTAKGIKGCLIRFKGRPKASFLINSRGAGKIEFELVSNKEAALANKVLKVKAFVQVKTNSRPELLIIDEPDTYVPTAVAGEFYWEYKLKVDDEGNPINFLKPIKTDSIEYKALSKDILELKGMSIKAEISTNPVEKLITLKLSTKNANLTGIELESRAQDYELKKSIALDFTLNDGNFFRVPFSLSLRYPKKKQQVVLTNEGN